MLIIIPFFVYKLGPEHYGIWKLVNSIITNIRIFNVGIGDVTIKFVSKYKAIDCNANLNRIVNTGFSI
jgi:O-antigen/teichoic acid export membrane protein